MTKFQTELENLNLACDIAIQSYKKFPMKGCTNEDIAWFISCRTETKKRLIDRQKPFNTLASLKYVREEIFSYFQEGLGQTVDEFWKLISSVGLPYKRENKLAKVFKRGMIKNMIEYDFVKDIIGPYLGSRLIDENEAQLLDEMLTKFENKK
jgi:hypothetical protein